jgi:tRNA uridine 5-carbamoylmethylation protein Kti12
MVLATQNGLKGYENDMDKFYKDRKKEYDKLKADYQKSKDEKGLKGLLNKINIFNKHENPDDDNYWNGMQKQFKYLSNDDNHEIN